MIKFFRKIRQKMLTENKFSKYFLYAIGEILLVVIGILIALSLNNWNEEIAMIKKERDLLMQMKTNLSDNLIQLTEDYENLDRKLISISVVLNHMRDKLPLHDGLYFNFYGPFSPGTTNLTSSAYETFKSIGLDVIRSDELRDEIINLYEISYPRLQIDAKEVLNNWEVEMIIPYYFNNFSFDEKFGLIPNNYNVLIEDQKYRNLLKGRQVYFKNFLSEILDIKTTTQKTIDNIDLYLE